MASTDLKLEEAGTLPRPGPVGRLVRLGFGGLCLSYVGALLQTVGRLMPNDTINPLILNGLVPGLFLVSYVVNIGFSRAWKKRPLLVSLALFAFAGAAGYLQTGILPSPLLAGTIYAWELYLFSHLGLSFVLAALLATPGCEMRAFHHAYALLTGREAKEHLCPVGPLGPIDRWEAGLKR